MENTLVKQRSVQCEEEKKITPGPIVRTNSHNVDDKSVSDRFIPCRSHLESSQSLLMSNVENKSGTTYSSGSDTSQEDNSSLQNYNALLENQFFGGDEALNEMNLS